MKINLQDIKLDVLEDKITLTGKSSKVNTASKLAAIERFIIDMGHSAHYVMNGDTYTFEIAVSIVDRNSEIEIFQREWNKVIEANKHWQKEESLLCEESVYENGYGNHPVDMDCSLLPTGRLSITTEDQCGAQWSTSEDLKDILNNISMDAAEYMYQLLAERLNKKI